MPQVDHNDVKLSYEEAARRYPQAVDDVQRRIRAARSKLCNEPFETFEWFYSEGETAYQPPTTCYRIYARRNRLMRCSGLYDLSHKVIPGNWSF